MENYQKRMLDEYNELKERYDKLNVALCTDGFREKVGDYQFDLMKEQLLGMKKYLIALIDRLTASFVSDRDLLNGKQSNE